MLPLMTQVCKMKVKNVSLTKCVRHCFETLANNLPFLTSWFSFLWPPTFAQVLAKNSVSDIEKREKKVLEKKLGEMEDELKVGGLVKFSIQF